MNLAPRLAQRALELNRQLVCRICTELHGRVRIMNAGRESVLIRQSQVLIPVQYFLNRMHESDRSALGARVHASVTLDLFMIVVEID